MDDEKKNKSFIYQLYRKYKDAKPRSEAIKDEKEDQAVAVEEGVIEPEIVDTHSHIRSLYELYSYVCDYKPDLESVGTIQDFEERLYSPITGHFVYGECLDLVDLFIEEINLASSVLLSDFMADKARAEALKKEAGLTGTEGLSATRAEPEAAVLSKEAAEAVEEKPPIDASLHVRRMKNDMYVLLIMLPPQEGGNDLDLAECLAALESNRVTHGINQELLYKIAKKKLYMQLFVIAEGTEPIHGIDGRIIDKTDCRKSRELTPDERGKVDFKDLDLYENVTKEQVICELIPAIDGTPGMDVTGKEISFRPGKIVNLNNGKNTMISEDGLLLLAAVDGFVSYRNGKYNVEPILTIKENVDYSVGNIDFSGDVVIKGDVRFGFTVKAQGNITVLGMVEGAELISEGDIIIKKGMNGNHSGILNAKGEVRVNYLEHCTVYAGGPVHAESIISCDIFCEDSVYLKGNRGIIIGGCITAQYCVEARMIGSKSQRETSIILGETPGMVEKKKTTKAELQEAENVLAKLNLNINYLNKLRGSLPSDKLSILTQLTEQKALYEKRKVELEKSLVELMRESKDFSKCYVRSNMIFPVTKISIGLSNTVIDRVMSKANVYFDGEEIQVGTM